MTCPRCGFPTTDTPCILCGQTDFTAFEMARFGDAAPPRFEFTVVVYSRELITAPPIDRFPGVSTELTRETQPRRFYFFPDGCPATVADLLKELPDHIRRSVLINGRLRPYSQELWLPLSQLVNLN